jgi:hypothetical protein
MKRREKPIIIELWRDEAKDLETALLRVIEIAEDCEETREYIGKKHMQTLVDLYNLL